MAQSVVTNAANQFLNFKYKEQEIPKQNQENSFHFL